MVRKKMTMNWRNVTGKTGMHETQRWVCHKTYKDKSSICILNINFLSFIVFKIFDTKSAFPITEGKKNGHILDEINKQNWNANPLYYNSYFSLTVPDIPVMLK